MGRGTIDKYDQGICRFVGRLWKRIGQGRKTPKPQKGRKPKYRPDAGRKAKEFGIAKAEAALIAEANDKKNVPLSVVLFELNALRFQFSWIKIFGATLKRPGHYKIWFESSPKHTVDEDYTPFQGTKGADNRYGITQSRINLRKGSVSEGAGWKHVLNEHFNPAKNKSQFTITENELRSILQSKSVVKTPISRTLQSADGIRYLREVKLNKSIGLDKFNDFKPTKIMTILTDKHGNLITATPGVIK